MNIKGIEITNIESPIFYGREPYNIRGIINGKSIDSTLSIKGYPVETSENCQNIEITVDELKGIIENIDGRDLSDELIGVCDEIVEDAKIIQKDFDEIGIKLSLRECEYTHMNYSDSLCASWIGISESCDISKEIYHVITGVLSARDYE